MKEIKTNDITIHFREEVSYIIDIAWPYEDMEPELEALALREIIEQLNNAMTLEQRQVWVNENCAIDLSKVGSELVINVCYPDNFDISKVKQIEVLIENFNSVDEIKIAHYYLMQIVDSYPLETDECCCSCC